jgi:hypothetical protein
VQDAEAYLIVSTDADGAIINECSWMQPNENSMLSNPRGANESRPTVNGIS